MCINNLAPEYISKMLVKYVPSRQLRSSDKSLLVIPKTQTSFGRRAFTHAGPTVWNALPIEIRHIGSLDTFKSRLKTHYFKQFLTHKNIS